MTGPKVPLRVRKAIVVLKETEYAQAVERRNTRLLALIGEADTSAEGKLQAHNEHCATAETVFTYLREHGINFDQLLFTNLPERFKGYDLIITVGGDGTFLSAAARNFDIPMLGVRSSPASVGHFALADSLNFAQVMDDIISGALQPASLMRMKVKLERAVLEGKKVRRRSTTLVTPVLNDVLVANNNAAAMARYILEFDGYTEKQDSSGIWVGPPAGSSAALRSAGGKMIPITAREFEFVVRESSVRPDRIVYKMMRGVFAENRQLAIVSRMDKGKLFVDGEHRVYDFNIGDRVVLSRHPRDLHAFVDVNVNARYEYFFGIYQPW